MIFECGGIEIFCGKNKVAATNIIGENNVIYSKQISYRVASKTPPWTCCCDGIGLLWSITLGRKYKFWKLFMWVSCNDMIKGLYIEIRNYSSSRWEEILAQFHESRFVIKRVFLESDDSDAERIEIDC